jgi:hypothetical protein
MRRRKGGSLKSGSGRKVRSRKQAIAIGLNEARRKGAKVPSRKGASSRKRATSRKGGSRTRASSTRSGGRKTSRKGRGKKK